MGSPSFWELQPSYRLPLTCRRGVVAAGHHLAATAGLSILQRGGNAVDAAIAAAAVMSVALPHSSGLGGDGLLQVFAPGMSEPVAIQGAGPAPRAATIDRFPNGIPTTGPRASTVPGLLGAWCSALAGFGRLRLDEVLAPAIGYAEEGVIVGRRLSAWIQLNADDYARYPTTASVFMPGDRPLAAGEVLIQPDLARTLRAIADHGPDVFYRGEIGHEIASFLAENGGLLTREDLADFRAEVLPSLRSSYRGYAVFEQPPPSQGFLVLEQLNILEGLDVRALGHNTTDTIHLMVGAKQLAFADRDASVGDPRFARVPVAELISKEHAAARRAQLDPRRAVLPPPGLAPAPASSDTTFLAAADRDGFYVGLIQSLFTDSAVVAGRTGLLLNNRLQCFSLDPRHPNVLAPGKRPTSTLNTYMLFEDGAPYLIGGSPGAHGQVQTNVQIISNLVDHGLEPQAAIEAPRWIGGDIETGLPSLDLSIESRVDRQVVRALAERGHRIVDLPPWSARVGSVKLIRVDRPRRTLTVAADPRRDAYVTGW